MSRDDLELDALTADLPDRDLSSPIDYYGNSTVEIFPGYTLGDVQAYSQHRASQSEIVPEPTPTITAVGDDGETTFKYYASYGDDLPSEQVGWVLIVGPTAPRYITPLEIAAIHLSMGIQDQEICDLLRSTTEDMLTQLRSRPDASDASSETAAVIDELQFGLAALTTSPSE